MGIRQLPGEERPRGGLRPHIDEGRDAHAGEDVVKEVDLGRVVVPQDLKSAPQVGNGQVGLVEERVKGDEEDAAHERDGRIVLVLGQRAAEVGDGLGVLAEREQVVPHVAGPAGHQVAGEALVEGADGDGGVAQTWLREAGLEDVTLPELVGEVAADGGGGAAVEEVEGLALAARAGQLDGDAVGEARGEGAGFELVAITLTAGATTAVAVRLLLVTLDAADSVARSTTTPWSAGMLYGVGRGGGIRTCRSCSRS